MAAEKVPDLTDAEIEMFEGCQSEEDWNTTCQKIKKVRGGEYPPDWWPKMKLSGRMDRILARFGATSELEFEVVEVPEFAES